MRALEKQNFTGPSASEIKRLQDNVSRAIDPLSAVPTLDGVQVGPVALGTSFAPVNHGLGRAYLGWQVIRIDASATVWEDFTWNGTRGSINMMASAACNVYLWVF